LSKAEKPTVDDLTRKKLLYAKQFYLHGEQHARAKNPVDRMIALHHFHIATEIALKAAYLILDPSVDLMNVSFLGVKEEVKKHFEWLDNFNVFLNDLNALRNKTQHKAEVVSPEDIPDYQMKTWNFLSEFFRRAFDVSFEKLDLTDRIEDERLRRVLVWARELIEQDDYQLSVAISKGAYEIGLLSFKESLRELERMKNEVDFRLRLHNPNLYAMAIRDRNIKAFKDDFLDFHSELVRFLERYVETNLDVLKNIVSAGDYGNFQDRKQFYNIRPNVVWNTAGGLTYLPIINGKPEVEPQKREANWVREYVIGAIIDWQERGFDPKWDDFYLPCFEWAKKEMEEKGVSNGL